MTTLSAAPKDPVSSIAIAITEAISGFKLWFQSEDKRRLRKAVDLADKIIRRHKQIHPAPDREIDQLIKSFYDVLA